MTPNATSRRYSFGPSALRRAVEAVLGSTRARCPLAGARPSHIEPLEQRTLLAAQWDRPEFGGNPYVTVTAIDQTDSITLSRSSGQLPFFVQVSASNISAMSGSNPLERPYEDLEFSWDFGDPNGTETFINPADGTTVNANTGQTGPEAAYVYRNPDTYTIKLTVRGKNGGSYVTHTFQSNVTASSFSGSHIYYDSVNGDEANSGTEQSPKKYLPAGGIPEHQWAHLKRGSIFTPNAAVMLNTHTRISAYGSGAEPVIEQDGADTVVLNIHNKLGSLPSAKDDIVISDVTLRTTADTGKPEVVQVNTEMDAPITNVYFDNLTVSSVATNGAEHVFEYTDPVSRVTNSGFWNTNIANHGASETSIYGLANEWGFVVGGNISGSGVDAGDDHHIYPVVKNHSLYRWINFGQGTTRGYNINTNLTTSGSIYYGNYHLIADNVMTGTNSAVEASNTKHAIDDGRFANFIVQGNAITQLTGNKHLNFYSATTVTVRNNVFWNNADDTYITFDDMNGIFTPNIRPQIYANLIYSTNNPTNGISVRGLDLPYVLRDNVIWAQGTTDARLVRANLTGSDAAAQGTIIDGNQYYAPNDGDGNFLYDSGNADDTVSFAVWQNDGFDVNGIVQQPAWLDPANGDFRTNAQEPFLSSEFLVGATPANIQAEDFDKGGEAVAYHDTSASNTGGVYRIDEGVDIFSYGNSGGLRIGGPQEGEWLEYSIDVQEAGEYELELRVSQTDAGATLRAHVDGVDITGSLSAPATGSFDVFTSVTKAVTLTAGKHVLRITQDGEAANGYGAGLDWFKFTKTQSQTPYHDSVPFAVGPSPVTIQGEDFDLGGEGVAYHDTSTTNTGGQYRPDEAVDIMSHGTDLYRVGGPYVGEWMEYTIDVQEAGTYELEFRVSQTDTGATFHAEIDGVDVTGPLAAPNTGSFNTFSSVAKPVSLAAGQHVLRFAQDAAAPNGYAAGLDWITVTAAPVAIVNGTLVVQGTNGNDSISVEQTSGTDIVTARLNGTPHQLDVDDFPSGIRLEGRGGNDSLTVLEPITRTVTLWGDAGNDTLVGNDGSDSIDGGDGDDYLVGDFGNDTLNGGAGTADTVDGGPGDDTTTNAEITPAAGTIAIVNGVLTADGSWGMDSVTIERTGTEDVIVRVNEVSQQFNINAFNSVLLRGNAGYDNVRVLDPVVAGTVQRTVTLEGGDGDDSLFGSDGEEVIRGDGGSDVLWGYGGADALFGGAGNDFLRLGAAADYAEGGDGDDLFDAADGAATDSLFGGLGTDEADVDAGDATSGIETIV